MKMLVVKPWTPEASPAGRKWTAWPGLCWILRDSVSPTHKPNRSRHSTPNFWSLTESQSLSNLDLSSSQREGLLGPSIEWGMRPLMP